MARVNGASSEQLRAALHIDPPVSARELRPSSTVARQEQAGVAPVESRATSDLLSTKHITANMCLSIIGTTVLGIAFQMQKGGWLLSPLLLIFGCVITSEMTRLTSATIDQTQAQARAAGREVKLESYADFAELAFGDLGRKVSSVASTSALLGMICGGLVMISKNLQYSAPIWPGDDDNGKKIWAIVASATTAIYSSVELAPLLKISAKIGPIVCVLCVVLAWSAGASAIGDLRDFPKECRRGLGSEVYTSFWPHVGGTGQLDFVLSIANIMAYGFYCFAVVVTVPSLKGQMKEPSQVVSASSKAYGLCTVLFLVIMVLGYGGFGNLGPESIIDGMRTSRPVGWWGTSRPWETGRATWQGQLFSWMIIVNLLLTDSIYVPCTVLAIEGCNPRLFQQSFRARIAARVGLVIFRCLVATEVTSFISLTNFTSSAFCILLNILMPIVAYYATGTSRGTSSSTKAAHSVIFVFGIFVLVCGTFGSLRDILNPPQSLIVAVGESPRQHPYGISEACSDAYAAAVMNSTFGLERHHFV